MSSPPRQPPLPCSTKLTPLSPVYNYGATAEMGWMRIRRSPDYSRLTVDNMPNIQSSRVDITLLKGSNVEYMLVN